MKRYSTALLGAITITFLLFLGMHYLIAPEVTEKPRIKGHGPIEIGKIKKADPPTTKIRMPERITDFIERETTPKATRDKITKNVLEIGPYTPPDNVKSFVPQDIGLSEGDIQPLRKFAPAYPRAEQSRGIEGYVVVSFTVNKMGAVENIVIIESTSKGFERPTLKAVAKYKYKPRVIDGVAVEVLGVMEKISFEIKDS